MKDGVTTGMANSAQATTTSLAMTEQGAPPGCLTVERLSATVQQPKPESVYARSGLLHGAYPLWLRRKEEERVTAVTRDARFPHISFSIGWESVIESKREEWP
jgi:hypothetical protein